MITENQNIERPTKYSPELLNKFFNRIAKGESARNICKDDDMPEFKTFERWLSDVEIGIAYSNALKERAQGYGRG